MVSVGAGGVTLYVDGAPAGGATDVVLPDLNGDVLVGGDGSDRSGGLSGILDEVGISRVPRTAWWARVSALGMSPDTTIVAFGSDESKGTASKLAAYLAMMRNLLAQVSLDGLVVITITALMGLASFQVLLSKAALLGRVEHQDARFLAEFKQRFARDITATRARAASSSSSAAVEEGAPMADAGTTEADSSPHPACMPCIAPDLEASKPRSRRVGAGRCGSVARPSKRCVRLSTRSWSR